MALVKYKNSAGDWIPVQLSIPTIEVDSFLSSASTNPVQNKVIKEALDNKVNTGALSAVAISGNYSDLNNLPTFATINGQDITKTDNIIIKDKVYTIYTQLLTGQSSLTSDQIASNKSAYDSVLANENAVYYFASSNLNTALLSTHVTILSDSLVTFVSNIIAGSDLKDITITMVQVTINSEGNIVEESNPVVNIPTEEKVQELLSFKQDNLVSGVNIKTINNQSILIENEDITNIQISSDIIVDSTISETSENPVQNKIIKAYVDDAISELNVEVVDNLESTETTSALSANQGRVLKGLVDSKMDSTTFKTINGNEITGEGNLVIEEKKYNIHVANSGELSDEQKAENKIIFDLAASGNPVSICYLNGTPVFYNGSASIDDELATISYAGNNYFGVINSDTVMQEFLALVDIDSEGNTSPNIHFHKYYLDNVAAIDSKQDTLVSGNNIKTINGETILGEGNIEINSEDVFIGDDISADSDAKLWIDTDDESGETGESLNGGLELRELKTSGSAEDNAYNLETLELIAQRKAIVYYMPSTGFILYSTCIFTPSRALIFYGAEGLPLVCSVVLKADGSIETNQFIAVSEASHLINSEETYLSGKASYDRCVFLDKPLDVYVVKNNHICICDEYGTGFTVFYYNHENKRYVRTYNADTGEIISDELVPSEDDSITIDTTMSDTSENAVQNKVIKEYVDSFIPADFNEDFNNDFTN